MFSWCAVVGLGTGGVAGDVTINRLVLLAFAVPQGCLALLSSLALLGILTLGGALHLVGRIRALCMVVSTKNKSTAFPESLKGNSRPPAVLNHSRTLPQGDGTTIRFTLNELPQEPYPEQV